MMLLIYQPLQPLVFDVTFAIASGDATIDGSNVTANSEGTYEVTASQAGDVMYNAAPDVTVTVVAIKKDQTITFAPTANVSVGDTIVLTASATSSLTAFTYSVVFRFCNY